MRQALKQFIFQELVFTDHPERFGEQDDLLEAGLDSMGIMRLVMFIEERFGVVLPDHEITPENLRTLSAIESWINRHRTSDTVG
ncbi:MAG: acyl carrier protein [Gammaproteobacteria bacterium]|nr:acyl carrier protein [Gammaproteobacteria bacterium]MCB1923197.1 acyl carrier protein [Gammaproteobacteria bacterium]